VEDLAEEGHLGWRERVVLGELELGGEDAAFKRGPFRALDEGLPLEEVVFGDRAGGDAVWWIVGQGAVFREQPAVGGGLGHVGLWDWSLSLLLGCRV